MAEEYKVGTLKEIAIGLAEKQDHMINTLLEETPVASALRFEPASHGMWNAYEEVEHISTVEEVDIDAPLPELVVDTNLKKTDLQIVGGKIIAGEDKLQIIGKEKYFAKRLPLHLRQAGMMMEKNIIYKNIRDYAIQKGKAVSCGASSGKGFSIIAFREIEGENIGLYNPTGFGSGTGKLLDVKAINGGNVYEDKNGVMVYGMRLKGYIGYQMANPHGVAALVNIDPEHLPTEAQIDDLILSARADMGSRGFLMMHPKMLSLLNQYKAERLQTTVTDKNLDRTFTTWNGVKIMTSYNFENGTEKTVSL